MPFNGPLYSNQHRGAESLLLQVLNSPWMENHTTESKLLAALYIYIWFAFFSAMWTKAKHFLYRLAYGVRMNQLLCTINLTASSMCVCVVPNLRKRTDSLCVSQKIFLLFSAFCWDKRHVWLIFEQPGWADAVQVPGIFTRGGSTGVLWKKNKIQRINLLLPSLVISSYLSLSKYWIAVLQIYKLYCFS